MKRYAGVGHGPSFFPRMTAETREMLEIIAVGVSLVVAGAAPVWLRRRALRQWHLIVPAVILGVTVPLAIPFLHDLRTHAGGEAAAWGRMGELIVLMGLLPIMLCSAGALLAAVFALGLYGLNADPVARRRPRGPWYAPLFRPRTRAETMARLYVSLGSMVVVGVLWLLGVRPGT